HDLRLSTAAQRRAAGTDLRRECREPLRARAVPHRGHRTGSTDMGDLAHLMPVIHPYVVAAEGKAHGADWRINEPRHGYLTPAKLLAMTAIDLLHGDAAPAREILAKFEPAMTKEAYLAFQRGLVKKERYASAEV